MATIPQSFLHDPREQVRGVLGQGYVASIIAEGSLSRSLMVLTDRRLYQAGKIFERVAPRKVVSTNGKKVVSVGDITGTSIFEQDNVAPLVLAGPLGAIGILVWIAGSVGTGVLLVALSVLITFVAFLMRKRFFVVEYAGGAIATECRWYTAEEIDAFQKRISIEKDKQMKPGDVEPAPRPVP